MTGRDRADRWPSSRRDGPVGPRAEYPLDLQPFAEPVRGARLTRWRRDPVLVHWPVAPRAVQVQLPAGLRVDTFDGQGWIGLVASHAGGRLDRVDVDVRTYVIDPEGRRTLWYLAAWTSGRAMAAMTRAWGVACRWSPGTWAGSGAVIGYHLGPPRARPALTVEVSTGTEVDDSAFVVFVTSRWGVSAGPDDGIVHARRSAPPGRVRRGRVLVLGGAGLDELGRLAPGDTTAVAHRCSDGPERLARFGGVDATGPRPPGPAGPLSS